MERELVRHKRIEKEGQERGKVESTGRVGKGWMGGRRARARARARAREREREKEKEKEREKQRDKQRERERDR